MMAGFMVDCAASSAIYAPGFGEAQHLMQRIRGGGAERFVTSKDIVPEKESQINFENLLCRLRRGPACRSFSRMIRGYIGLKKIYGPRLSNATIQN